ncbi:pyrimidine-nucleoside phosphorylase [Proteinivorax hydrogeniformans]|uniref:Pyrimidine-nucleoside phosphorylase n=1 Tax=Proteinivorax hydrogeniformans TaxID=1826727 RepID=A0AAU8HRH9_9FIRM
MRVYDLIYKKRQGEVLTKAELDFLISGYNKGEIPDYQMSAFAMAVFFKGMTSEETANLTQSIINSGETIDLSEIEGVKVDKHSTGGVGDTVSLIIAPIIAHFGAPFAKMSGRGLGHTGGTLDKLESIEGFNIHLTSQEFIDKVNKNKVAVMGQTAKLAPADGKLYSLRDVTATVDSIPLIASSIMSKKLAAGADGIVLDVKTGDGAFMKSVEDSFSLAKEMVDIGTHLGKETVALVTDMDQPLGEAIGNSLEVIEAFETLRGRGPEDLTKLCITVAGHMLVIAKIFTENQQAENAVRKVLESGEALAKMKEFISAQGGDPDVVDNYSLLPVAKHKVAVKSPVDGNVKKIKAETLGKMAMMLGAGRAVKTDSIDHSVGIIVHKKQGDKVKHGEPLATVYSSTSQVSSDVVDGVINSYELTKEKVEEKPLIYGVVTREGIKK